MEREIFELYVTALSKLPEANVVAYSTQSIRSDWPKGKLNLSHVFNSLPWTGSPVLVDVPAGKLADIRTLENVKVLRQTDLNGKVTIATSRYLAGLFNQQLHETLPIRETGVGTEFEYFADFLKTARDLDTTVEHPGWTYDAE